jgi:transcription initiation factor TFIIIB Brf1 subunit/transcription initiation factor TFIIB|uniref:Transcription factor TFIIB cyclin-like domain-containing protein n=1 Tax=viral metagenome TaxID=1070528 RepID=A0A6C0J1R7_9ZZZZ
MPESDFTIFEKAFAELESNGKKIPHTDECQHDDTVEENGTIVCLECGEQIGKTIMHEKEWRFYGQADGKRSSDPNRVQMRKSDERNINKDVENMGFSETIVSQANEIYTQVTKGQIFRGDSRKAVIFACIYHSYKIADKCQTPKDLMETFGLNKKSSLKGLKIVSVHAPKDSPIHTTSITAIHHINDLMDKFSATKEQKKEVIDLYVKTKNRSSKLNRARPQSVSAALIFYWICLKKLDITLKKFACKADLSELTINKNAKEVALVLGTPSVI